MLFYFTKQNIKIIFSLTSSNNFAIAFWRKNIKKYPGYLPHTTANFKDVGFFVLRQKPGIVQLIVSNHPITDPHGFHHAKVLANVMIV